MNAQATSQALELLPLLAAHVRGRAVEVLAPLRPAVPEDPILWMKKNIHLSEIHADAPYDFEPDPYQIEPLRAQFVPGAREVTIMAVEQTGKTLTWVAPLCYRLANAPGPSWIIYPSDDDAAEKNEEMIEPLLRAIPSMAAELSRPYAKRLAAPARYKFTNSVTYFSGAGNPAISKTIKYGYCDETDHWQEYVEAKIKIRKQDNIVNMEKRLRSVAGALLVDTSSPTTIGGRINRQYQKSSKGVWQVVCLKCGHLEPSHNLLPLQWQKDDDNNLLPETIRWICPDCRTEHTEDQAAAMNRAENGAKYIHARPELLASHPGFQWGALACPRAPGLNWQYIAETVIESGRTHTREKQAEVDNSIRGLPYMPRKARTEHTQAIMAHCGPAPDPEKVALIIFAADTQDESWFWIQTAFDQASNFYLLSFAEVRTQEELDLAWQQRWEDILPALGGIDEGGHRAKIVQQFVAARPGLYTYKGAPQAVPKGGGVYYKLEAQDKRLNVRARHYQGELLHHLHFQPKTEANYLHLPPKLRPNEAVVEHLAAFRKVTNRHLQDADNLENWHHETRPHDYFDCLKETLALFDFARDTLPLRFWRLPMPWHKAKAAKPREPSVTYQD